MCIERPYKRQLMILGCVDLLIVIIIIMKYLTFRYSIIAVMKDRIYLVNSWPFLVRYLTIILLSLFIISFASGSK